MRLLLSTLLALTILTSAFAAQAQTTPSLPILQIAATPLQFSAKPGMASQVVTVQGRSCRRCRRGCVRDFKIDCYGSESQCRRGFVLCMRSCFYDYCS